MTNPIQREKEQFLKDKKRTNKIFKKVMKITSTDIKEKIEEIVNDNHNDYGTRAWDLRQEGIVNELYSLYQEGQISLLEEVKDKDVPVIYREDNGIGLAIPRSVILELLSTLKK